MHDDGIDDKLECFDFGDNPQHKIDKQLQQRILKAAEEVLSHKGGEALGKFWKKTKKCLSKSSDVEDQRYRTGETSLDPKNIPKRVRVQRYPAMK